MMGDAAHDRDWIERGRTQQHAGRLIDAMLCYRRALVVNPRAVEAQYHLGEIWRDLGRRNDALAAWRSALIQQPTHLGSLLAFADEARHAGAEAEAAEAYRRVLAIEPRHSAARAGMALIGITQGDADACIEMASLISDEPSLSWDDLARALAVLAPSPARSVLLGRIESIDGIGASSLVRALMAEDAVGTAAVDRARKLLNEADAQANSISDLDALRRFALAAAAIEDAEPGSAVSWAARYAKRCVGTLGPALPSLWPKRMAGQALRLGYIVAPGPPLVLGNISVELDLYLQRMAAAHPREHYAVTVHVVGSAHDVEKLTDRLDGVAAKPLGTAPGTSLGRALGEADFDALIDLAGMAHDTGPLLAQHPARTIWTYASLRAAHAEPLITHRLPALEHDDDASLDAHRIAVEAALLQACVRSPWFADVAPVTPEAMAELWRSAVRAHQAGSTAEALAVYRRVIELQPSFASARYLIGALLREDGDPRSAASEFAAALEAAPAFVGARAALAALECAAGRPAAAARLCRDGLALKSTEPELWRNLGLAELALRSGEAAHEAFKRALELDPAHAETHYNHGVALQMLFRRGAALRAYQRAVALDPKLSAAHFNMGVILDEEGYGGEAVAHFERVLRENPKHVAAHQAIGAAFLGARRIDEWIAAFQRFEAACADALPLAVRALEVCQYVGDFAALDRYLDRLSRHEFRTASEAELADCLEELTFLLLYFDVDPAMQLQAYRTYDALAPRVYGEPLALTHERRAGKLRIGYLSADLRNHVMGKMMWEALRHHDRDRFELYFYSLSRISDEWTERYRGLADRFEQIVDMSERDAALTIASADLDVLVDLGANTGGAKPGILAFKPARVQITHVASAGVVGLSTIDYKLTDALADLPESQSFQLETLLPMRGCVYPYRHIASAARHPFHRERLGIANDAIVLGAFVSPLKLSRRCLSLWREILERLPKALIALSPLSAEMRSVYARLLHAGGIPWNRVIALPQGRDDAENQSRYEIVDLALDPMPYGGVNGTLEALDMGVPVVTLCGRKHGERTAYSILSHLGVTDTIAHSGRDYVEIAVRLATDSTFMANVRATIRSGLAHSTLSDMRAYTRNLESAYIAALEQRYPAALSAVAHD